MREKGKKEDNAVYGAGLPPLSSLSASFPGNQFVMSFSLKSLGGEERITLADNQSLRLPVVKFVAMSRGEDNVSF